MKRTEAALGTRFTSCRPPLSDNPATVGFQEGRSGAFFSSDCFGGPMPTADLALGPDVREIPDLESAMMLWAAIDSPWARLVDPVKFGATIDPIRRLDPSGELRTGLVRPIRNSLGLLVHLVPPRRVRARPGRGGPSPGGERKRPRQRDGVPGRDVAELFVEPQHRRVADLGPGVDLLHSVETSPVQGLAFQV